MLEETAAKLPRDLREVFWDDPRRRALRQAHAATIAAPVLVERRGCITRDASRSTSLRGATEDRLARVLEITRELANEHDVPRLLQRVTDHAVALLGAERGFVLLVGRQGELEAQTARTGAGGDDPHARFSRSVAERVVEGGEPVVTISARDDERLAQAVSVHQLMIQSIACVPIRGAPPVGRTIGALYVETRLRPGVRFKDELPTLRAFADQAAIAIENARLLAENFARTDDLARANVALAGARDELARMLGKRTEQLAEARRDLRQVRAEIRGHFGYAGLIGTSAAMRRLYALMDRVKDTDIALLVTGESGTGKEMVARAIHQAGPRAKKPFLGVNCGAIPANLLESELFGSVRGAFTGAERDRRGVFQEADGRHALARRDRRDAAEDAGRAAARPAGEARPTGRAARSRSPSTCGSSRPRTATSKRWSPRAPSGRTSTIASTSCSSAFRRCASDSRTFRPSSTTFCRSWRRAIAAIGRRVSREALRKLCAQPWPGNVRQLEHVLLNAWLMSEGGEIGVDDLELPSPVGRGAERERARRGASVAASRREPGGVQGGRSVSESSRRSPPATGTA